MKKGKLVDETPAVELQEEVRDTPAVELTEEERNDDAELEHLVNVERELLLLELRDLLLSEDKKSSQSGAGEARELDKKGSGTYHPSKQTNKGR